ncbi:hypothetical protein AB0F17_08770 [Nonomuraea sp. NPDC026600]|uniref:hypothetical protein n=1 Tax=Nonomuraea sp. NPDC026600 TaxID=3155363 RepID=UPI003408A21D
MNPEHLEPVTLAENNRRGNGIAANNARKEQCQNGHPFDYTYKNGGRKCMTCQKAYKQRKRDEARAAGAS